MTPDQYREFLARPRYAYLHTAKGFHRFDVQPGYAAVRVPHFGCLFWPSIRPGDAVHHDCPTGPDVDRYAEVLRLRALRGWSKKAMAALTAEQAELHAAIEPRANQPIEITDEALTRIEWVPFGYEPPYTTV